MIHVHVLSDIVTWRVAQEHDVQWTGAESAASLLRQFALPAWGRSARVGAALNGRRLSEDELGLALADGADVVLAPDPGGTELIVALVLSLVSMALNFVASRMISMPSAALDAGERGDESSQAMAWDRMATEYRPGFPVPIALGEGDLPGTAVFVDINASAGGTNIGPNEELRAILALCEGPIHSIGGIAVDSDDLGATEFQPWLNGQPRTTLPIPADIRVDGNRIDPTATPALQGPPGFEVWRGTPNVRAYVRLGGLRQAPMPAIGPRWGVAAFSGSRQTELVELDLGDEGSSGIHTITDTDPIGIVACVVSFQAGLYDSTNSALPPQPASVTFDLRWRAVGATPWSSPTTRTVTEASQASFALTLALAVNSVGPIEVEMRRTSRAGGAGIADRARWRQITFGFAQQFAFPRTALLGLVLQAGENATGTRAQFQVRGKWLTVQVWDATINSGLPSSKRYWELPGAGDPYAGIWSHAPGRNPAWLLAAFLLHPGGLGRFVTSAQIDWPAFRDWADFCDQNAPVNGIDEAFAELFFPLDSSTPAWEAVARIYQAGRAAPLQVDRKISVVYRYRDAHGRGTNSVPAKVRTQLVTTANVQDFSVEFHDTFARPAVITAEFQNQDKDFAHDTIDVHDPRGGHQDPITLRPVQFRKQTVRFHGQARQSQVLRESLFMHALNALVDHTITFTIGREALASQVGDLIGVVHDVLRPFDTDSFALRTTAASAAVAEIRLNRALTLAAATTYRVIVRQTDGTVVERQITSVAGSYAAGDLLTLETTIDASKGAVVCFGEIDKIVVDYEISAITLAQPLTRTVRADRWVPEAHDVIDVGSLLPNDGGTLDGLGGGLPSNHNLLHDISGIVATNIRVRRLPGRSCEISWERPDELASTRARVYVRLSRSQRWFSIGETDGSTLRCDLAIGEAYDVNVLLADRLGRFQVPGGGAIATLTVEEFPAAPPPDVSGLRAVQRPRAVLLTWDRLEGVAYYEVRNVGGDWEAWYGVPLLARTEEPRCHLPMVAFFDEAVSVELGVSAVSLDGLRSANVARVSWAPAAPAGLWEVDNQVPDPGDGGFASDNLTVDLTSGDFTIQAPPDSVDESAAGGGSGWAQSQVFDAGFDVAAWLSVYHESRVRTLETVDELDFELDSGEAAWWLVDSRPASERQPGLDPSVTVDDLAVALDDLPSTVRVGAAVGEAGVRGEARLYLRTAQDVETITAQPWVRYGGPLRVVHRYAQLRIEVDWEADGLVAVDVRRVRLRRYA